MWPQAHIVRELLGSVAIAVQRGGALSCFDGYEKTLRMMRGEEKVTTRSATWKKGKNGSGVDGWGDSFADGTAAAA